MNGVCDQGGYAVRLDWGAVGAEAIRADVCVVVDVVMAAAERWSYDNSLRPALEDQLGAGAILSHLVSAGYGERLSPEAAAAAELFVAGRPRLAEYLHDCVSGRELSDKGFRRDIGVAAALDVSPAVPVRDGAFTAGADLADGPPMPEPGGGARLGMSPR